MSHLYFVALVPGEPVLSEVREMKMHCKDHYDSAHALRSPAHITLYPPFRADAETIAECSDALTSIAGQTAPFEIEINGIGCFKPRVIFAAPTLSAEMEALQAEIAKALNGITDPKKIDSRPFHPHMTIAFRDLTKANFHQAWDFFKKRNYRRHWNAVDLCILIHGDTGWSILRRFDFVTK